MDLPLVALRFVRLADGGHLDLATGARVALRIGPALSAERRAFDVAGDALMRVWHPGFAEYLDFGPLGSDRWFEASLLDDGTEDAIASVSKTVRADAAALLPLLGVPGVSLDQMPGGARVIATVLPGAGQWPGELTGMHGGIRCPGLRLIERPLVRRLRERLDDRRPSGVTIWNVRAPAASGWRTCWRHLARELRQEGYIPLAAALLEQVARSDASRGRPWLAHLTEATVVTPIESDDPARLSALLLALGVRAGRTVIIRVSRSDGVAAETLEPLTAEQLESAVICAEPSLPGDRVRALAHRAGGSPGRFAAALLEAASHARWPGQVHDGMPAAMPSLSRADGEPPVLVRARALAEAGRSAACRLLLRREGGALLRRGEDSTGLRVWARLAVSCAASGHAAEAERAWRDAWRRAVERDDLQTVLEAAPDLAAAWIAELAPGRAEAMLRSVLAVPEASPSVSGRARVLLGEALWWQGRWQEALAAVERQAGCPAACLRVRAYLAVGEIAHALQQASVAFASAHDDGERAMAECARLRLDVAAGDSSHRSLVTASLEERRLPGADEVERCLALAETHVATAERIPLAQSDVLRRLIRARGPRLARARARIALALDAAQPRDAIEAAVRRVALATGARALMPDAGLLPWPWPTPPGLPRSPMIHDIVAVLEVCQHDADPDATLQRLCALLLERTAAAGTAVLTSVDGALMPLGRSGRPPQPSFAERAQSLRATIGPERAADGVAAAWTIRQGDELTGVLAARWTDGPPTDASVVLLQAASAAMAPVVALARATRLARAAAASRQADEALIGSSAAMIRVRAAIERAAPSPFPVLIEGESGAGKELVARAIHAKSDRRNRRFAALNCAALADDLIEAELFGHARGAFTGAIAERAGLFEEADGGTLFLDEVGELSPRAQAKLLRAIQEGEIRRVGETRSRKVDARIVAATNRSLEAEAAAGRFRTDLRFRLDVIRIDVPPLRGRPEDIAELAFHFWREAAIRVGSRAVLGREALAALARYDWPGNVRELQNAMAAMAVAAPRRGTLGPAALPAGIAHVDSDGLTLDEARRRFDAGFVRGALARAGGSRSRAATELGLSRQGLAKLMERLGIALPRETMEV
jgi:DNA-binding NtrC family response regulator